MARRTEHLSIPNDHNPIVLLLLLLIVVHLLPLDDGKVSS